MGNALKDPNEPTIKCHSIIDFTINCPEYAFKQSCVGISYLINKISQCIVFLLSLQIKSFVVTLFVHTVF